MPHDSDAIAYAEAENDLARLKREQAYGQAHPWQGYCGDDDARADLIHDLEVWLKENA